MATDPFDGVGEINYKISQTSYIELISAKEVTSKAIQRICQFEDEELVCDDGHDPNLMLNNLAYNKKPITGSKRQFTPTIQAAKAKKSKPHVNKQTTNSTISNPDYSSLISSQSIDVIKAQAAPILAQTVTNYITNPEFETGLQGWSSDTLNLYLDGVIQYTGPSILWDNEEETVKLLSTGTMRQIISGLEPFSVVRLTFDIINSSRPLSIQVDGLDQFGEGNKLLEQTTVTSSSVDSVSLDIRVPVNGKIRIGIRNNNENPFLHGSLEWNHIVLDNFLLELISHGCSGVGVNLIESDWIYCLPVPGEENGKLNIRTANTEMRLSYADINGSATGSYGKFKTIQRGGIKNHISYFIQATNVNESPMRVGYVADFDLTPESGTPLCEYNVNSTIQLPPNFAALQLQSALEQLPNIGSGNVLVRRGVRSSGLKYFEIEFIGDFAGEDLRYNDDEPICILDSNYWTEDVSKKKDESGDYLEGEIAGSHNQKYEFTIIGEPVTGYFMMTFPVLHYLFSNSELDFGEFKTAQLDHNASVEEVKEAIETALNTPEILELFIGEQSDIEVEVTLDDQTYTIEFQGSASGLDFNAILESAVANSPYLNKLATEPVGMISSFYQTSDTACQQTGASFTIDDTNRILAGISSAQVFPNIVRSKAYVKNNSAYQLKINYTKDDWADFEVVVYKPTYTETVNNYSVYSWKEYVRFANPPSGSILPIYMALDSNYTHFKTDVERDFLGRATSTTKSFDILLELRAKNISNTSEDVYAIDFSTLLLCEDKPQQNADCQVQIDHNFIKTRGPVIGGLWELLLERVYDPLSTIATSQLESKNGIVLRNGNIQYGDGKYTSMIVPLTGLPPNNEIMVTFDAIIKCLDAVCTNDSTAQTGCFAYNTCSGSSSILIDSTNCNSESGRYTITGTTDSHGTFSICFRIADKTEFGLLRLHACAIKPDTINITNISAQIELEAGDDSAGELDRSIFIHGAAIRYVLRNLDFPNSKAIVTQVPIELAATGTLTGSNVSFDVDDEIKIQNRNKQGIPVTFVYNYGNVNLRSINTSLVVDDAITAIDSSYYIIMNQDSIGSLIISFPDANQTETMIKPTNSPIQYWQYARATDPTGPSIYQNPKRGGCIVLPNDPIFNQNCALESISILLLLSKESNEDDLPDINLNVALRYIKETNSTTLTRNHVAIKKLSDIYTAEDREISQWAEFRFDIDLPTSGLNKTSTVGDINRTCNGDMTMNKFSLTATAISKTSCEPSVDLQKILSVDLNTESPVSLFTVKTIGDVKNVQINQRDQTNLTTTTIIDNGDGLGNSAYLKCDPINGKLYWIDNYGILGDPRRKHVMSSDIDGSNVQIVYTILDSNIAGFVSELTAMCVDYINNKLYIVWQFNASNTEIDYINIETGFAGQIAALNPSFYGYINGISIDISSNKLYLTSIDSNNVVKLITIVPHTSLSSPITTSIKHSGDNDYNPSNNKLYIVSNDNVDWIVARIDTDGNNLTTILAQEFNPLHNGIPQAGRFRLIQGTGAIALSNDKIYFTAKIAESTDIESETLQNTIFSLTSRSFTQAEWNSGLIQTPALTLSYSDGSAYYTSWDEAILESGWITADVQEALDAKFGAGNTIARLQFINDNSTLSRYYRLDIEMIGTYSGLDLILDDPSPAGSQPFGAGTVLQTRFIMTGVGNTTIWAVGVGGYEEGYIGNYVNAIYGQLPPGVQQRGFGASTAYNTYDAVLSTDLDGSNLELIYRGNISPNDVEQYQGVTHDIGRVVAVANIDEIQSIILPNPTGGTFDVSFSYNDETDTVTLDYDIAAAEFQSSLEGLSTIGAENVTVSGSGTAEDPFIVTFINNLGGQDVNLLEFDTTDLVGAVTAYVATIRNGTLNERQTISKASGTTANLTITFNGADSASISPTSTLDTIEEAIGNISTIGDGNISVTGTITDRTIPYSGPWYIDFIGDLASQNVPQMTVSSGYSIVTNWQGGVGANELQQLISFASGGTYTLTISNEAQNITTDDIAYDATSSEIQATILDSASDILDPGDLTVTALDDGSYRFEFDGQYASTDMPLIQIDSTNLTGGTIVIEETTKGSGNGTRYDLTIFNTTGGTYTLTVTINDEEETTEEIAHNAPSTDILDKLLALELISGPAPTAADSILVDVSGSNPFQIDFDRTLGDVELSINSDELVCDSLALIPIKGPPYTYDLSVPNEGDEIEESIPCLLFDEANVSRRIQLERDLFDPDYKLSIKKLTALKGLKTDEYTPYLRNFSTGRLESTTYDQIAKNGSSILLISNDINTESYRSRIVQQIQHNEILPSRMENTI